MIHPDVELRFINEEIGYGVFATKFIPRGTITWTLCDFDLHLTFSAQEVKDLDADYQPIVEKYSYIDPHGKYVLCWDLARYMNHSCLPNNLPVSHFNEIATRDILPGQELTCDYGFLNYSTTMSCFCGEDDCRKEIKPYSSFEGNWKKISQEALAYFDKVEQPLEKFIKDKDLLLSIKDNQTMIKL